MERKSWVLTAILFICLFSIISFKTIAFANDEVGQKNSFVIRQGNKLMLDGMEFRFAGTNNYYFHYRSNAMIDDVIDNAAKMGIKVIRCWGFLDGTPSLGKVMQPELGRYDEHGFEQLDYAVKKAGEKGIKLVIPFVNNWNDFGGMNAYLEWAHDTKGHDSFYTNEEIKTAYKNYVSHVLNRNNQYTGVKYKDDPTIMTWELTNEARCEIDKTGKTLLNWTKEMSQFVKNIDKKHLVALGDEGFFNRQGSQWAYNGTSGVDWDKIIALPTIDYGTVHLYPDSWGDDWKKDGVQAGSDWIKAHANAAKAANKPVVLEEYGIGSTSITNRDFAYETWTNLAYESGYAGTMFWILSGIDDISPDAKGLYPDFDGFRIVNDNNSTVEILKEHANRINGEGKARNHHAYIISPSKNQKVHGKNTIKVKVTPDENEVERVLLNLPRINNITMKKENGYYFYEVDTTKEKDGQMPISVVVNLKGGKKSETSSIIDIKNRTGKLVTAKKITFDTGLDGWEPNGVYQAEILAGQQTKDLGAGAFELNIKLLGIADWEELRIANKSIDLSQYVGCRYELYIPKENLQTSGELRPYVALSPGWVKCGVDKNNVKVTALPTVTINGKEYLKMQVTNNFADVSKGKTELNINFVGNKFRYQGPIYFDNIELLKEE